MWIVDGSVTRCFSNGKDGVTSWFFNSVDGLTDWLSNSVECGWVGNKVLF